MAKKRSGQSRHGPFANTEAAVPPLTLNTWQASQDEPFNGFAPTSSSPPAFKTRRTATGRLPAQSSTYSSISIYDPADFVRQSQSTLTPLSPRHVRSRRNSGQNLSPSSCLSVSPSASMSDGLTNATTLSSIGMSRSDSLGGSSFCGGFDMLKVDSQMSESMLKSNLKANDTPYTPDTLSPPPSASIQTTDLSLSLSHTGAMVKNADVPSIPLLPDTHRSAWNSEDLAMSRKMSSDSADFSKSRISRRSQEQAALSTRPLAPKEHAESMSRQHSSSPSSSSGSEMARQISADGSKIAISKAKYQRPTHEKIKCTLCNMKPDGYRGPHELRRHVENKHGETRKVWVCVDRSPDRKFLSNCKQCREKKRYGAYYNAACHLRRIHWNPREKGKKTDKSGKARGGNGGGDYPPMDTLKLWMEEINVPITSGIEDDDEEDDIPVDANPGASVDFSLQARPENATAVVPTTSHHQQHYTPAYDGEFAQTDFSTSGALPTFFPRARDNPLSRSSFPFALEKVSTDVSAPAASTTPLSATPHHYFDNNATSKNTSVTDHPAFGNFKPTDLSLTSSMNSPVDPLDQFNPFLFEPDLDFS